MTRRWVCRLLVLALATAIVGGNHRLSGAEPTVASAETRTYGILVDGKNSGQSTLTITRYSDGSESVSGCEVHGELDRVFLCL